MKQIYGMVVLVLIVLFTIIPLHAAEVHGRLLGHRAHHSGAGSRCQRRPPGRRAPRAALHI